MTVINALIFDEETGGMVADSQSSTPYRKYDISRKVLAIEHPCKTVLLIGGSGKSNILSEASTRLKYNLTIR